MRRIVLILVLATSAVFGWMFYQYSQQQKEQQQLQSYETVLYEKTEQISIGQIDRNFMQGIQQNSQQPRTAPAK